MSKGFTITNGRYYIDKDPQSVLDYVFDWSEWLAGISPPDVIVSFNCFVTGSTSAAVVSQQHAAGKVTAMVGGGENKEVVKLTCHIQTAAGRQDDRAIYLRIKDR
jgi:hypothetical protein